MTPAVRVQEPFVCGERKIYPVVAETSVAMPHGMTGGITPVALIIEENGIYSCTVLGAEPLERLLDLLIETQFP